MLQNILIFIISISRNFVHFKLFRDGNYPNPVHKLKHRHKSNRCLLRLVASPTWILVWSAEDTFHLLNRFTLSATALCTLIITQNCNYFFTENFTSTPTGRGTPHTLPRRGLWSLSTLRPPGLKVFLRLSVTDNQCQPTTSFHDYVRSSANAPSPTPVQSRGILFQYTSEKRWTFVVLKDFSRLTLLV